MKKTKSNFYIALIVSLICAMLLGSCAASDKKYFSRVGAYSFWDNNKNESIPQYRIYNAVDDFLSDGSIYNGQCIGSDGKIKKVLFLGWDGVRADALSNIFYDNNDSSLDKWTYEAAEFSGLHYLKSLGGLYMAYAGGENKNDTQQSTSTSAGWTSELTGGWNTLHGVATNNDVKKANVDTFLMKYAKKGLNTGLAFDWGKFFDLNLKEEVKISLQNPNMPIKFCDIDRKLASSIDEAMNNEGIKNKKDFDAESLELYNAVANISVHTQSRYDIAMRDYLVDRISVGDDIVGGIFHNPDSNGHTKGFSNNNSGYVNSVRNANLYLFELLIIIESRINSQNEDWLVIVATDHGGSKKGHGEQVLEHRTTWIASNKPMNKYFGNNYNGFNESM